MYNLMIIKFCVKPYSIFLQQNGTYFLNKPCICFYNKKELSVLITLYCILMNYNKNFLLQAFIVIKLPGIRHAVFD